MKFHRGCHHACNEQIEKCGILTPCCECTEHRCNEDKKPDRKARRKKLRAEKVFKEMDEGEKRARESKVK